MGGLACAIPHFAIMASDTIPTHPGKLLVFDEKLRACFTQTGIVAGIVEAGQGEAACDILQKSSWTAEERKKLYDMLEALYDT